MAKLSFEEGLERMRQQYINAPAARRGEDAIQRMESGDSPANRLINAVSATEALGRAFVLQHLETRLLFKSRIGEAKRPKSKEELYRQVESLNAVQVLKEIAEIVGGDPAKMFGAETWPAFEWAVKYRNALIHEAVPIERDVAEELTRAAREIFLYVKDTYVGGWGEPTHRMKRLP